MIKKKLTFFLLLVIAILLCGCSGGSSPQKVWNNYIKAMNSKNLEKVALFYYDQNSKSFEDFINSRNPDDYFNFKSLKTKSFTPVIENEKYYSAEIVLNVVDLDGSIYDNTMMIYFYRNPGNPWKFISEVFPNAYNLEDLGNKPNNDYYNNIVKKDKEINFYYKYIYGGTPGIQGANDYVKIVYPIKNQKVIEIPDTIEGAPVKIIGDYAFFKYFRIFTVTFPSNKLQSIKLPSSLQTIEKYAFYQTKNLREIELPSSLQTVGDYAFAASGLKKIVINVDDEKAYSALEQKFGKDRLTIVVDSEVFMGDNVSLSTLGYQNNQIEWSTSNPDIATVSVTGNNARLIMNKPGTVEIRAKLINHDSDNEYVAKATVTIKDASEKTIQSSIPTNPSFSSFYFTIRKTFYVGEEVTPTFASKLNYNWTTSDPNVAVVDGTKIKFVGSGTVKLTASLDANSAIQTSATVTVKDASEKNAKNTFTYEGFTFSGARDMFVGDIIRVKVEGLDDVNVEWSSSDESIATVGRYSGIITALKEGTVTIRGVRTDNPSVESVVTIKITTPVKGVTFGPNALDRLYDLEKIIINSRNPNSVTFDKAVKLNDKVKIYVPKDSVDAYKVKYPDWANKIVAIDDLK